MLRKPTTFAPVKSKDIISGMMNTVKKGKNFISGKNNAKRIFPRSIKDFLLEELFELTQYEENEYIIPEPIYLNQTYYYVA